MNQADVSKLISKLRVSVLPRHRNLKNIQGPEGRLNKLKKTVTALIKYERIELYYNRADEARGYAERLISDAIRYGDCHTQTMKNADFWLIEKQLIHKLFKVLVPRYQNSFLSYTQLFKAPQNGSLPTSVLELRGNPYPSLKFESNNNRYLLHNILLEEAKKEFRLKKYNEISENIREDNNK